MSTYLVKNSSNNYLTFEKKRYGLAAQWVGIENAKHFETVEQARKELKDSLESMLKNAQQKAEISMSQGGYPTNAKTNTVKYNVRTELNSCSKEKLLNCAIAALEAGLETIKRTEVDKREKNNVIRAMNNIVKELNKLTPQLRSNTVAFSVSSYASYKDNNQVDKEGLENYIKAVKELKSKMSVEELEKKGVYQKENGGMAYALPEGIMELVKVKMPVKALDFLPGWFNQVYTKGESLIYEAHLDSKELLDKIEMYFIRSSSGWWCEDDGGYLGFAKMIHKAQVFYSEDTAKSLLNKHKSSASAKDAIIVKGSYIMERVIAPDGDPSKIKDEQSAALYAACEAKNIEQALEEVLKERRSAHVETAASAVKMQKVSSVKEDASEVLVRPRRLGL